MRLPERILATLLILCWLCAGIPALADTSAPLRIDALEYRFVDDPDTTLDTLLQEPDNSWQQVEGSRLNLGITRSVLWLRFELPTVPAPGQRLLEIANHKITDIHLQVLRNIDGHWQPDQAFVAHDRLPLSQRAYPNRNFIFPLELQPDVPRVAYLRIQNNFPMILPLHLWSETEFQDRREARALFQGLYLGILAIMAIYNLCIYFYTRDRSYGYYSLFVVCLGGFVVVDRGLALDYLWPDNPGQEFQATLILTAIGCASSIPFTTHFLNLRENGPGFARAFRYLLWTWLAIAFVAAVHPAIWLVVVVLPILLPFVLIVWLLWKFLGRKPRTPSGGVS